MYSDMTVNNVKRLWGFPNRYDDHRSVRLFCSLICIHAHSTHWNKMATPDFGPVTLISCETALSYAFGLFHGMQQTDTRLMQTHDPKNWGGRLFDILINTDL